MKVVLIGGGGNGTVIASAIEDCQDRGQAIECVGFLDDVRDQVSGYPVLGQIQNGDWRKLPDDYRFVYTLTAARRSFERSQALKQLGIPLERFATIIHPTAVVSRRAHLGLGVVAMPHVVIGPDVTVGDLTLLYAQSFLGHDCVLDDLVFVANNATVGAAVRVKTGAYIGTNCSVRERVTVGEYAVVGMGSVVLHDVAPYDIVAGNPAKVIGAQPAEGA